jgi:hypothetical protein
VRRLVIDGLWSIAAIVLLLAALAVLDPRVRNQFSWRTTGRSSEKIVDASTGMQNMAAAAYHTARDTADQHTALMFFAVAGGVLLIFMLRT